MRKLWLGVCLVLGAASTVQAQQWPGYANPYPYYGNSYYNQPAPRYYYPYNPYANGAYYRPAPTYYAAPAPSYPAAAPNVYGPISTTPPASNGPAFFTAQGGASAQPETVVEVPPQPPRVLKSAEPVIEVQPQPAPRVYRTVQVEDPYLPSIPQAEDRDRGNIALAWDRLCAILTPAEGPGLFGAPNRAHTDTLWATGDYMASFFRPMRLAGPLVTTGSFNDPFPGSIGQPSTAVLLGSNAIDFGAASGGAVTVGMFLDKEGRFSLEVGGFAVMPNTQSFSFGSDPNGNPIIARPVTATDAPQGSFAVAIPGAVAGSTKIDFNSQLSGVEFNGRYYGGVGAGGRYDLLLGVRYARLAERMSIQDNYTGLAGQQVPFDGQMVDSVTRQDSFSTINQFIGPQIGGQIVWDQRWLNVAAFAKLGLGATLQQVNIDGSTTGTSAALGSVTAPGGILALPTNIGTHSRTVFGVLPEVGFNVGINLTDNIRLKLGYSVLAFNSVLRPGEQYPTVINSALAPTAQNFGNVGNTVAPIYRFADERFWTQSVNLGIEFHY